MSRPTSFNPVVAMNSTYTKKSASIPLAFMANKHKKNIVEHRHRIMQSHGTFSSPSFHPQSGSTLDKNQNLGCNEFKEPPNQILAKTITQRYPNLKHSGTQKKILSKIFSVGKSDHTIKI